MNFEGIIVGLATFLTIGVFHPIVIKAEYHFGTGCWWCFFIAGVGFAVLSLFSSLQTYRARKKFRGR